MWPTLSQVSSVYFLFPHAQDCRTGKVETCKVSMDSWVDSYGAQKEAFLKETVLKNRLSFGLWKLKIFFGFLNHGRARKLHKMVWAPNSLSLITWNGNAEWAFQCIMNKSMKKMGRIFPRGDRPLAVRWQNSVHAISHTNTTASLRARTSEKASSHKPTHLIHIDFLRCIPPGIIESEPFVTCLFTSNTPLSDPLLPPEASLAEISAPVRIPARRFFCSA